MIHSQVRERTAANVEIVTSAHNRDAHDLALATRNTADFHHLDIDLINPWDFQ